MNSTQLVNDTVRLAKASLMTNDELCRAAKIKPRWLALFKSGGMKDPGVHKVLRLRETLLRETGGKS